MNPRLHRFALFTACATFCLIIAGALVTSRDAGLAVPDWPLSYGSLTPPWVGNIRYEHGHRMVATFVGILTIVLAVWLWRKEPRRWVRRLGLAALGAVIAQGLLGGLTVIFLLPTAISVDHACLAQIFFCLTITLALVTGRRWQETPAQPGDSSLMRLTMLTTASIFLQLVLGAAFRHKGFGIIPHVIGAGVVTICVLWTIHCVLSRHPALLRPAAALGFLLVAQLFLGVGSYLVRQATQDAVQPLPIMIWVTVAHVATGALTLAASVWLMLLANRGRDRLPSLSVSSLKDHLELTKPNVTWLILMSAGVGFYLGSPGHTLRGLNVVLLIHTVIGTALVASGTAALNQWMERIADGKMRRTQYRPLPAGRMTPGRAFWFGLTLAAVGISYLTATVNFLTGFLGAFTCSTYLLCYTPLKSRTPHSTLVGAFPGAMPILMGWTAATGRLTIEGWVLYGILFLWQFPHFLSIAALYREDYERGGILMLPVLDTKGVATGRQIIAYTVALLGVSAVPAVLGLSGHFYLVGVLALGLVFFYFGMGLATRYTKRHARRLLQASVIYLPLVYVLMVLDKQ